MLDDKYRYDNDDDDDDNVMMNTALHNVLLRNTLQFLSQYTKMEF